MNDRTYVNFPVALQHLMSNHEGVVTRSAFRNGELLVMLQRPDENSKMTKPYLYMVKDEDKFPLDLSCESVLAEDWMIIK